MMTAADPIQILLAEDHHLVRAGIRALITSLGNTKVVAEASDGQMALEMIQTHQPDLVFMDIAMPHLNGLEVTERVVRSQPDTQVIILSMHANEEYVLQALQAGARGYLMKDADISEVQRAIEAVMDGKTYLTPAVSQHVAEYIRRVSLATSRSAETPHDDDLTPRQREILRLIAEGNSTRDIATQLNISIKTAEAHRANIMKRLDIYDVAGLTRYAIRIGLIQS